MTICVHALAKPLTKQYKYDNEKGTSKKKALRKELSKAHAVVKLCIIFTHIYTYIFSMMYIDLNISQY